MSGGLFVRDVRRRVRFHGASSNSRCVSSEGSGVVRSYVDDGGLAGSFSDTDKHQIGRVCCNHTLLFNCRYTTAVSRNTTCRRGGHRHHQVSSPSSTPRLNPIPVWILPQTIIVSCVWNHDNSLAADQETRNPNPDSGETWLLTECGRHGCPTLDMSSSPSARVDYVGSRRWHLPVRRLTPTPGLPLSER